ncbi:hypothetical protein NLX76_02415 [Enterobacter hormaechei]|uniref:hypothetical protein n=1 Tax=Enterobacter hormaechei TaxID=158836 RepID=UPI0020B81F73|nr:hypothetical protein [Enterobacter hormaechei]MCP3812776.1 hypothetical protein [Enterobacter hormaechei]MCP3823016.1 hypothetical protein [Enterobacter hormaechei]MCW4624435.1 hypothetical protein [Enterobacter hormaechei]
MKKLMTTAFVFVLAWGLFGLLVYATLQGDNSLMSIVVAAYWAIITLACFISPLFLVAVFVAGKESDPVERARLLIPLTDYYKRKGVIKKFISLATMAAIFVMLAYSGWVFTSLFYTLACGFVTLLNSVGRDKFEELTGHIVKL